MRPYHLLSLLFLSIVSKGLETDGCKHLSRITSTGTCFTSSHHDTQIMFLYNHSSPVVTETIYSSCKLLTRSFIYFITVTFTFQVNRKYKLKASVTTLTYPFFVCRQIHFCPPINICSIIKNKNIHVPHLYI